MLATKILAQDHREALDLMTQLEGVRNDLTSHKRTFEQLKSALMLHMREEEEIFYPALAQHEEFSDLLEYSIPEHEAVKENLAQMSELDPGDDEFQSLLTEMKAAVELHATNEEEDVFPDAEEVLGLDMINAIGTRIDKMKAEAGMTRSASM